jgi:hypothetical protein
MREKIPTRYTVWSSPTLGEVWRLRFGLDGAEQADLEIRQPNGNLEQIAGAAPIPDRHDPEG